MLAGIKADYLTPNVVKEISREIRNRLRDDERPDKGALKTELERLDKQFEHVVDTLSELGRSDALTARVRTLESERATVAAQLTADPRPQRIAPNVEKVLRARVESLERLFDQAPARDAATDEALTERASAVFRELLGHVKVVEEGAQCSPK